MKILDSFNIRFKAYLFLDYLRIDLYLSFIKDFFLRRSLSLGKFIKLKYKVFINNCLNFFFWF